MRKFKFALLIIILMVCFLKAQDNKSGGRDDTFAVPELLKGIKNYGGSSASIRIETRNKKVIYIDPVDINEKHDADLIFITHTHPDHYNSNSIKRIKKANTKIMITSDFYNAVSLFFKKKNIIKVMPNNDYQVDGIKFRTVVAYNLRKPGRAIWHSKYNNWVGYVLYLDNKSIYISGGTDMLDELKKIKTDIAFLVHTSGPYTMHGNEAAELANSIKPEIVIPYHSDDKQELEKFFNALDDKIMAVHYGTSGIDRIINNK